MLSDSQLTSGSASVYTVANEHGTIHWRAGSGGNVELLYLRIRDNCQRQGHGTELLRTLVRSVNPYATVYGFTRVSNTAAQAFYRKHGFSLTVVDGVYDDGHAVLFSARHSDLAKRLLDDS